MCGYSVCVRFIILLKYELVYNKCRFKFLRNNLTSDDDV